MAYWQCIFVTLFLIISARANMLEMEKDHSTLENNLARTKRDAVTANCSKAASEVAVLSNHTDIHVFRNDSNPAISLVWTGTQGALLALTTMNLGFGSSPSGLYRSNNYGRSFENISPKIHGDRILKDRGLRVNPVDTSYVMLVSDLSLDAFSHGVDDTTVVHVTTDSGLSFDRIKCPFIMRPESLSFNPTVALQVAALSMDNSLWVSRDFGRIWNKIDTYVAQIRWDPNRGDLFYYTKDPTKQMRRGGFDYELYRVSMYSFQADKIAQHVHSFGIQGEFLFVSIEYLNKNGSRVMHVSKDRGLNFDAAQIPLIDKEQFYSLLDMTEDMVFVHVDSRGSGGDGTIYTSDDRGVVYSESLLHHLYPNQGSLTDFYRVDSLQGVYITSQLMPDYENTLHSVITFDKGGTWESISAPKGSVCPPSENECKLQIHNVFSRTKGVQIPEFPKSSKNAPGIILAHGNIGDALNLQQPDVYISNDGGYSWVQPAQLKGPHYYEIGDSGGILYAVKAFQLTNILKFSVDEGQCWEEYKFSDKPLLVTGLSVEPGLRSTVVGLWGWEKNGDGAWRAVTIEFGSILKQPCRSTDYETWEAHESNELYGKSEGCLLGAQVVFKKHKKGTVCINGKGFTTEAVISSCRCTKTDFLCDYGYVRQNSQDCVPDSTQESSHKDICVEGVENVIQSKGYRRIPGDKCSGGFEPKNSIKSLHKSCIKVEEEKEDFGVDPSEFSVYTDPPPTTKSSSTGLIVFLVLTVIALVVLVVFLIRRRRMNSLRVKYSPLMSSDDSAHYASDVNVTDGSTNLVGIDNKTNAMSNGTRQVKPVQSYHDDSDEDLLVT